MLTCALLLSRSKPLPAAPALSPPTNTSYSLFHDPNVTSSSPFAPSAVAMLTDCVLSVPPPTPLMKPSFVYYYPKTGRVVKVNSIPNRSRIRW